MSHWGWECRKACTHWRNTVNAHVANTPVPDLGSSIVSLSQFPGYSRLHLVLGLLLVHAENNIKPLL